MTGEQSSREVFLSYSSSDASLANGICAALEAEGISCWVAPRDVMPGESYADAIVQALDAAKVVVLILSENAATSPHVLREVERATSKRHPVVSLRIDAAPMPASLQYFLNTTQWLDATKHGLVDALPKLVEAVRRHLDHVSAAEAFQPPAPHRTSRATTRSRMRWVLSGGLVAVALVLACFFANKFTTAPHPLARSAEEIAPAAAAIPTRSIAVLPFTDMSEKKDQEYLADGMAEEILNLLAQVPDLLVPARTSSFYFKGKPTKIPDIARELGVVHILEGSVRRAGDRVRVTAQLVRADNGYHLWSETYDRDLKDTFAMQDDIANAVVQALQIKLSGGELSRQRGGTQNLEAYTLYLRAVSAKAQSSKASLAAAGDYLNEAIQLDPSYGMAWSELAYTAMVTTDNGFLPTAEGYEKVRRLAQQALDLSPDLADAHACLQYVHRTLDWDWVASETEGRRALAIDPTNRHALLFAGMLSNTLGNWDEAERQLRAALVRDPLNTYVISNLANNFYGAGRYAEAESTYRKLIELAPAFMGAKTALGSTLLLEGRPEEALAMVQQEAVEENRLFVLPIVLQAAGHQAEADEALKAQIAQRADMGWSYSVAMTYAFRGDHDLAMEWLERAYNQKDAALVGILGEPLFRNLADDARYKAFLRKMNLPE